MTVYAQGVDYAWSVPSVAALQAAGKTFACRYGYAGTSDKQLHAAELARLEAGGIWVVANVEGAAGALTTAAVGRDWAAGGVRHFEALGMPRDRPVYLSVDFDCTAAQWSSVRLALAAACNAIGLDRVGVYGSYNVCMWAARDKVASWFWQTYAWSHDAWMPGAHIQQYRNGVNIGGADCDLDRATQRDYGQWLPGQSGRGTTMAGSGITMSWGETLDAYMQRIEPLWVPAVKYITDQLPGQLTAIQAAVKAIPAAGGGAAQLPDLSALENAVEALSSGLLTVSNALKALTPPATPPTA